ncbi:unnamed protein product [Soboliphyme baturini]|uniref:Uncharacterized protein n=1 Tax=Soboliphyme baturini TaxID=241478 RepID=A0A183ICP0_9BILA|nr:unnamed protein product [Soboliphyme baturini]
MVKVTCTAIGRRNEQWLALALAVARGRVSHRRYLNADGNDTLGEQASYVHTYERRNTRRHCLIQLSHDESEVNGNGVTICRETNKVVGAGSHDCQNTVLPGKICDVNSSSFKSAIVLTLRNEEPDKAMIRKKQTIP